MRVLVAYASMHGATAEIAKAVAEELRGMGLDVEVVSAEQAGDTRRFDAVILGSGVYAGRWRKEALHFGERHAGELRGRPVWMFESGPIDTSADEGKAVPAKAASKLAGKIGARQHVIFGGQLGPEDVGEFTRRMLAKGDKTPYGDFRNFERIRGWARAIGTELQGAQPVVAH